MPACFANFGPSGSEFAELVVLIPPGKILSRSNKTTKSPSLAVILGNTVFFFFCQLKLNEGLLEATFSRVQGTWHYSEKEGGRPAFLLTLYVPPFLTTNLWGRFGWVGMISQRSPSEFLGWEGIWSGVSTFLVWDSNHYTTLGHIQCHAKQGCNEMGGRVKW